VRLNVGEAVLGRVVHADPVAAEEVDGWPPAGCEQRVKQARLSVRLERAPKDGSYLLGREFDCLNWYATTVLGNRP
jgi:hypothetical protein